MLDTLQVTDSQWQTVSTEEKKMQLYRNQKKTLDLFLERRAISQEQYNKSLYDLTTKMGMEAEMNQL